MLLKHSHLQRFNPFSRHFDPCILCHQPKEPDSINSACQSCNTLLALEQASCQLCGDLFDYSHTVFQSEHAAPLICGACIQQPPKRALTITGFAYQYPVDYMISQLKFNAQFQFLDLLTSGLIKQIRHHYTASAYPDAIIPIPLHRNRVRERGFNQALLISQQLSMQLGIPILKSLLYRSKASLPQSQLNASDRQHNVDQVFQSNTTSEQIADYPTLVLVDDVITTGHTMEAAATCLIDSGFKTIHAWCLARA